MERGFPWYLVTVDIDGTLTRTHGWKEIAVAFGRLEGFEETNRRFFAHQIDEDVHLADLLDLATGHTVAEVEAVLERTPMLAGIAEGISQLHDRGAEVAVLTHNPTYVADWYRRTFGFDAAEGVAAQAVEGGSRSSGRCASRQAGGLARPPLPGPDPAIARGARRRRLVGCRGVRARRRRGRLELALS